MFHTAIQSLAARVSSTTHRLDTDSLIDDITEERPAYPVLLVIGPQLPDPDFPYPRMAEHRGVRRDGDEVAVYRPRIWERYPDGSLELAYETAERGEFTITIPSEHITRIVPVHGNL